MTRGSRFAPAPEAQHGFMHIEGGGIGTRCEQQGYHGQAMGGAP